VGVGRRCVDLGLTCPADDDVGEERHPSLLTAHSPAGSGALCFPFATAGRLPLSGDLATMHHTRTTSEG